jgi:CMP-N-acetylneuraminic acid synthetase
VEVLGIVPARGGSKGVPLKNIQPLAGRPLMHYALQALMSSPAITDVLLSTDSEEIAEVGRSLGADVPFLRPAALAEDDVPLDRVVAQCVGQMEEHAGRAYDYVVLVQPTSPLIRPETITAAVEHMDGSDLDLLLPVKEVRHIIWLHGEDGRIYQPERRNRQYLKPIYWELGAPKVWRRSAVVPSGRLPDRVGLLVLDPAEALDIDGHRDLGMAELLLQGREANGAHRPPRVVAATSVGSAAPTR